MSDKENMTEMLDEEFGHMEEEELICKGKVGVRKMGSQRGLIEKGE